MKVFIRLFCIVFLFFYGCNSFKTDVYWFSNSQPDNRLCEYNNYPIDSLVLFKIDSVHYNKGIDCLSIDLIVVNNTSKVISIRNYDMKVGCKISIYDTLITEKLLDRNGNEYSPGHEEFYMLDSIQPKGTMKYGKYIRHFSSILNDRKNADSLSIKFQYFGGIVIENCWYKIDLFKKASYVHSNTGEDYGGVVIDGVYYKYDSKDRTSYTKYDESRYFIPIESNIYRIKI
jgi:hypothetical protein